MNLNLTEALRTLPRGAAFRIANEARPAGRYLFNSILPERLSFDWEAKSGSMKVITTMAGLVGMDSPYPEGGAIVVETFSEKLAKIAIATRLPEEQLRHLHNFVREVLERGGDSKRAIVDTAFNMLDKLVVQAQQDRSEWLRGQALTTGAIDWTFGKKRLKVDYGIPSASIRAQDTGNDAWHGSASKFWLAVRHIRRTLKGDVRAIIMHGDTVDSAKYNAANSMATVSEDDGSITFRKLDANGRFTEDIGDRVTIVKYNLEGEVLDLANPGKTIKVPFMPRGVMLGIGNNNNTAFEIGAGSTDEQRNDLGYTHVGPTVEGDFARGPWARLFVPEARPWSLEAEGVKNLLPVIEEVEKIAIATTETE